MLDNGVITGDEYSKFKIWMPSESFQFLKVLAHNICCTYYWQQVNTLLRFLRFWGSKLLNPRRGGICYPGLYRITPVIGRSRPLTALLPSDWSASLSSGLLLVNTDPGWAQFTLIPISDNKGEINKKSGGVLTWSKHADKICLSRQRICLIS